MGGRRSARAGLPTPLRAVRRPTSGVARGLRRQPGERLRDVELVPHLACERQAVEEARPGLLAVTAHVHQPGVIDQRLDESPVVAVATPQLKRLAEALLGFLEPALDHGVPPLLRQRPSGAIGISNCSVKLQRLAGERVGTLPLLSALARTGPGQQRIGDRDRVLEPACRGHGGVAQRGCVCGGDEDRAAAQSTQRSGLDGRFACGPRRRRCRLQLRFGVVKKPLGEGKHAVPVKAGRAARRRQRRGGAEHLREPAANLMGVGVPGQRPRERDRHARRLVYRARLQQPLERQADVAALLRELVEPLALVRARRLLRSLLAIAQEVAGVLQLERCEVLVVRGPLGRELADRVEHREAHLRVPARIRPQQGALVQQRGDKRLWASAELAVAHRLRCL